MDALWPLNEHRSFQCAFHWVSVLTGDQWIRNQHLYKTLFLAHPTPPLLLTPSPSAPPPRHSVKFGIHRRFIWDASASVRTLGLGKIPSFALNGGISKTGRFFRNSFSGLVLCQLNKTLLPFKRNKASLLANLIECYCDKGFDSFKVSPPCVVTV